jgi:hypothetical protein
MNIVVLSLKLVQLALYLVLLSYNFLEPRIRNGFRLSGYLGLGGFYRLSLTPAIASSRLAAISSPVAFCAIFPLLAG